MTNTSETNEIANLVQFTQQIAQVAQRGNGLVFQRGDHGYHILFNESEMTPYFDAIRDNLAKGKTGAILQKALATGTINADASNSQIWKALVQSLEFSGVDFEHLYQILPSKDGDADCKSMWNFNFEESIVLSHTVLLVPVMQQYGPLAPKLDLKGPTKKFEQPMPLLVVGMNGDCVKGKLWDAITKMAEEGDESAMKQRANLLDPGRLQQKMRGLARALLDVCRQSPDRGLQLDSVLVGAGAFGGSVKALAQPFADSLNDGDLPFDNSKDEVNFFMFPPPRPEDLTLEQMQYRANLNPKKGLGAAPDTAKSIVRVCVAGFDPISLAPHGTVNRVFSAEGQLAHATDMLQRLTEVPGVFVPVQVPKGQAWASPSAFFAKPQQHDYKDEEAYDSVRFVPAAMLQDLGVKDGEEVQLLATETVSPRVWNGDSFEGWTLSLGGVAGKSWQETLMVAKKGQLDAMRNAL